MRKKALALLLGISFWSFSPIMISQALAGQCDYPDDRARDGSRCGNRAASVRPGGRNPDAERLIGIVIIGAIVFGLYFFITSKNNPFSSPNNNMPNSSDGDNIAGKNTPRSKDHPLSPSSLSHKATPQANPQNENEQSISQEKLATEAETLKIIQTDFGYALDTISVTLFNGLVHKAAHAGQNDYDAAVMFMIVQMDTLYPVDNDNGPKNFVELHSHNLLRVLPKVIGDKSYYLRHLNEIRRKHKLDILDKLNLP